MSCENCTCSATGQIATGQWLPDTYYHLQGTLSPDESARIACDYALAQLRAQGLSPEDSANDAMLQMFFGQGLQSNDLVVQTEPLDNQIQKAADVLLGTSSPNAPVTGYKNTSQPSRINWTFILGAILILAVGFILVFK
jgi:hypothetical protein